MDKITFVQSIIGDIVSRPRPDQNHPTRQTSIVTSFSQALPKIDED